MSAHTQSLGSAHATAGTILQGMGRWCGEGSGDILLFPALFLQLPGESPPSLAPLELGPFGAHRASVPSI